MIVIQTKENLIIRNKYFKNFFLLLVSALLVGCSKNNDLTKTEDLLSSISFTCAGGCSFGTSATITFSYKKKLLSSITANNGFNFTNILFSKNSKILSYKLASDSNSLQYNSDSTLITSSTVYNNGNQFIYAFTYDSNDHLISQNGNPVKFSYPSTTSKNPSSSIYGGVYTTFFEYDDHPNPLTTTYNSPALYFLFYPYIGIDSVLPNAYSILPLNCGANNVTKTTSTDATENDETIISYTYSASGYPLTATSVMTHNGSLFNTTDFIFTYTQGD